MTKHCNFECWMTFYVKQTDFVEDINKLLNEFEHVSKVDFDLFIGNVDWQSYNNKYRK